MTYVTVSTEVEVDLSEFDTDELIEELACRGISDTVLGEAKLNVIVDAIYQKRRLGKDYQAELDQLIYNVLGRIV